MSKENVEALSENREKTALYNEKNHKSCTKDRKTPQNLEGEQTDFLHFYQIIHKAKKVEIHYFI